MNINQVKKVLGELATGEDESVNEGIWEKSLPPVQTAPNRCEPAKKERDSKKGRSSSDPRFFNASNEAIY